MSNKQLEGKKALVTGSTSGIGRATAVKLAEEGATIYTTGRRSELGEETVRLIEQAGGRGHFVVADVSDLDDVARLAREVGDVDVLVNNAAATTFAPTPQLDPAAYQRGFDTSVRGAYFLTAALAPGMVERGGGSIVNISSTAGAVATPFSSLYGATKGAIDALTRAWAVEFGPRGIRVNAVAPGPVRTDTALEFAGEVFAQMAAVMPLRRIGEPEEIAEVVLFLASARAAYVTGAVLYADGGALAT